MLIEIYIVFLLISFVFIVLGEIQGMDVLKTVGFTFLFLLGAVMHPDVAGSIEYKTGSNITEGTPTVIEYTRSEYTDGWFGFLLMVVAVLGFALVFLTRGRSRME